MTVERKGGRPKKSGLPDLGKRVNRLMDGMNASELSAKTGISKAYLSRIINGEVTNPTIDFMIRIGNGLGVTVSELIGQTPLQQAETYTPTKRLKLLKQAQVKTEETAQILSRIIKES